jgi:hypothetical protein
MSVHTFTYVPDCSRKQTICHPGNSFYSQNKPTASRDRGWRCEYFLRQRSMMNCIGFKESLSLTASKPSAKDQPLAEFVSVSAAS